MRNINDFDPAFKFDAVSAYVRSIEAIMQKYYYRYEARITAYDGDVPYKIEFKNNRLTMSNGSQSRPLIDWPIAKRMFGAASAFDVLDMLGDKFGTLTQRANASLGHDNEKD